MMGGLVPAPVHYISGKCPHLAINVLSSPFSKCFFYRRRVLQQCLRAFVHKISFAQFFHQFLILQVRPFLVPESWHADVEGGIWTRPYDWQWYGGPLDDFDEDDDCYSKASNCYCRHCLWRLRRRSLSTWRSQSTCRTSFRPSSPRLTTSSWTKRWKESRNDVEPVDEVSKEIYQVTDLDKLHSQQQTEGENKYSTIQKVARSKISENIKHVLLFRWNVDQPRLELHFLRSSSRSLRPSGSLPKRRTDLGPVAPRSVPPKPGLFASSSLQPIWPWNRRLWVALYPIQSFLPPTDDKTQPLTKILSDQTKCGQTIWKHLTGPQAHWIKGGTDEGNLLSTRNVKNFCNKRPTSQCRAAT